MKKNQFSPKNRKLFHSIYDTRKKKNLFYWPRYLIDKSRRSEKKKLMDQLNVNRLFMT